MDRKGESSLLPLARPERDPMHADGQALNAHFLTQHRQKPRVPSSLLGPILTAFGALSGRLQFTVRRHKFNQDYLSGWMWTMHRR